MGITICECRPHCGCTRLATMRDEWGSLVCDECGSDENKGECSDGSFRCLRASAWLENPEIIASLPAPETVL